jgi:hypothetical protein
MEQCHAHGLTLPSSFAWRLITESASLLDALDAAEARIAEMKLRLAAVERFMDYSREHGCVSCSSGTGGDAIAAELHDALTKKPASRDPRDIVAALAGKRKP